MTGHGVNAAPGAWPAGRAHTGGAPGRSLVSLFDPWVAEALARPDAGIINSFGPDAIATVRALDAEGSRRGETSVRAAGLERTDHRVPTADGAEVVATILRSAGTPPDAPAVYFIHGGGMFSGSRYLGVEMLVDWIVQLGVVGISVEYRLAPEHPHPVPVEDCRTVLLWAVARSSELGFDPGRVVVAGSSAGGGIAAALCLLLRDQGGFRPCGQLLAGPMLDDRNNLPSTHQFAGTGVWDRTCNETGWGALLGSARGTSAVSPYAAPSRAAELHDLPPAFVDCGSAETFRDEDIEYAVRLARAGVPTALHVWPGGCHAFDLLVPAAPISRQAVAARRDWLRTLLAPDADTSSTAGPAGGSSATGSAGASSTLGASCDR